MIDNYQINFINENSSILIYVGENQNIAMSIFSNIVQPQYALFENFLPCADTRLLFFYSGQLKPLPFNPSWSRLAAQNADAQEYLN